MYDEPTTLNKTRPTDTLETVLVDEVIALLSIEEV